MTSKWLVLLLLSCCMMAAMARRGRGGGRGRRNHGNPVLHAACLVTNSTGHVMKNRTCLAGQTCDLGPLAVPDCKSTTLYARFCRGTPREDVEGSNSRMRLIRSSVSRLACRLLSTDGRGTIDVTRPCQNATCTLGPLFPTVNNTQVQAMFCERPVTAESCAARLPPILDRLRQTGQGRRQRFRREIRPQDILSALGRGGNPDIGVCRVRDGKGKWLDGSRTCPTGGAGCNIGPVRKYTFAGVQERWFCEDDQEWMADRACKLKFDDYEERPENAAARCRRQGGACAIGPVELDLPEGAADAFFCLYPIRDVFSFRSKSLERFDTQSEDSQSEEEFKASVSMNARSLSNSLSEDSVSEDSVSEDSLSMNERSLSNSLSEDSLSMSERSITLRSVSLDSLSEDSAESLSADSFSQAGPPSGPPSGGPPPGPPSGGPTQGGPPQGGFSQAGPPSGSPPQGGLLQGFLPEGAVRRVRVKRNNRQAENVRDTIRNGWGYRNREQTGEPGNRQAELVRDTVKNGHGLNNN